MTITRRGIALPTALLVLALLALLVVAALDASARAASAARADGDAAALTATAEDALASLAASFPDVARDAPVGGTWSASLPAPPGLAVRASIAHVAAAVWWATVEARGERAPGAGGVVAGGRRRLNQLFVVPPLGVVPAAALVAAGPVSIDASVRLATEGDTSGCPALSPDSAMVVVDTGAGSTVSVPAGIEWRRDPRAGKADSYARWRSADADSLAAHADIVVASGATASPDPAAVCTSPDPVPNDWGSFDGSAPCGRRSAVVHALGDLELTGGSGGGVLLVDGRLRITGPVRWSGLVMARGGVEALAEGAVVSGAMLSSSTGRVDLGSGFELRHSRCRVWRALAATARPVRVGARGWTELL